MEELPTAVVPMLEQVIVLMPSPSLNSKFLTAGHSEGTILQLANCCVFVT
jgi:hypothetical protein